MVEITLEQMVMQWEGANLKFERNCENVKIAIGNKLRDAFRANFDKQAFFADKWAPLKPQTLRKRPHLNPPILRETGLLQSSITYDTRRTAKGFRIRIFCDPRKFTKSDARHSFNYAAIHNEGLHPRIKKRQFIGVSKSSHNLALREINYKIFEGLPGAFKYVYAF